MPIASWVANSVQSGACPATSAASATDADQHHRLHRDDEAGAVEAVGEHAGRQRQQQHRPELGEHQQPDQRRRSGAVVDVGGQREVLHPRADVRRAEAMKKIRNRRYDSAARTVPGPGDGLRRGRSTSCSVRRLSVGRTERRKMVRAIAWLMPGSDGWQSREHGLHPHSLLTSLPPSTDSTTGGSRWARSTPALVSARSRRRRLVCGDLRRRRAADHHPDVDLRYPGTVRVAAHHPRRRGADHARRRAGTRDLVARRRGRRHRRAASPPRSSSSRSTRSTPTRSVRSGRPCSATRRRWRAGRPAADRPADVVPADGRTAHRAQPLPHRRHGSPRRRPAAGRRRARRRWHGW